MPHTYASKNQARGDGGGGVNGQVDIQTGGKVSGDERGEGRAKSEEEEKEKNL